MRKAGILISGKTKKQLLDDKAYSARIQVFIV